PGVGLDGPGVGPVGPEVGRTGPSEGATGPSGANLPSNVHNSFTNLFTNLVEGGRDIYFHRKACTGSPPGLHGTPPIRGGSHDTEKVRGAPAPGAGRPGAGS